MLLVTHVPVPVLYVADDPVIESDITQKSSKKLTLFVRGWSCSGFEFRGLAPLAPLQVPPPLPSPSHYQQFCEFLRAQTAAADDAADAVCQLAVSLL